MIQFPMIRHSDSLPQILASSSSFCEFSLSASDSVHPTPGSAVTSSARLPLRSYRAPRPPRRISTKPFRIHTSVKRACNPCRIRTSKTQHLKSFRIRTSKKKGGGRVPNPIYSAPPNPFLLFPQPVNIRRTPSPATPFLSVLYSHVPSTPGGGRLNIHRHHAYYSSTAPPSLKNPTGPHSSTSDHGPHIATHKASVELKAALKSRAPSPSVFDLQLSTFHHFRCRYPSPAHWPRITGHVLHGVLYRPKLDYNPRRILLEVLCVPIEWKFPGMAGNRTGWSASKAAPKLSAVIARRRKTPTKKRFVQKRTKP